MNKNNNTSLEGLYACIKDHSTLEITDVNERDNSLKCIINSNTSIGDITLHGTGLFYETGNESINIGFTAGLKNDTGSITEGWSGMRLSANPSQLKLGAVRTLFNANGEGQTEYLKDLVFQKHEPVVINMDIIVDAEKIVDSSDTCPVGSCGRPLLVEDPNCIFMVSKPENETFGYAHSNLNIKAGINDAVTWRMTSLSFGGDYFPFLYEITPFSKGKGILDSIEKRNAAMSIAKAEQSSKCELTLTHCKQSEIHAVVKSLDPVEYQIRFMLLEPKGSNSRDYDIKGYYYFQFGINRKE